MHEHKEMRLSEACEFIGRGTSPVYVESSRIFAIGQRCVRDRFISSEARPHSEKHMSGTLIARSGDILLNSTGTGTIGRSCIFSGSGEFVVDSHVTLMRPNKKLFNSKYLLEAIRTPNFQKNLETYCFSGSTNQIELNRTPLLNLKVPCPKLKEQEKIAEVLNEVDRQIDAVALDIAKLENYEIGIIESIYSESVDSGRTTSLDELVRSDRPICYGILMPGYGYPNGIPVIKVKNITSEHQIDTTDLLLTSPRVDSEYKRSKLKTGDLLFTIRGTVGRMAITPDFLDGANITQDTARISLDKIPPEFVMAILRANETIRFIKLHTGGVAVQGINLGDVRRIPIPLPERSKIDRFCKIYSEIQNLKLAQLRSQKKQKTLKHGLLQQLIGGTDAGSQ